MTEPYARLAIAAWRNDDVFEFPLRVEGLDPTDLALAMQVRLAPDTPGAPLIDLAKVTNGNAQGLRVTDPAPAGATPAATIRIRINKSTMQALPYSGELGSITVLSYALLIAGHTRVVGEFQVLPSTYGSDAAPANRSSAYGSIGASVGATGGATLTIAADGGATLTIAGADLVAAEVAKAAAAAAQAAASAAQSAAALAAAPYSDGASRRAPMAVADAAARGAFLIGRTGRTHAADFVGARINRVDGDALVRNRPRYATSIPADVLVFNIDGQSLAVAGGYGGGFPTPPGRNYAFVRDKDNPGLVDIKVYDTTNAALGGPGRMTGMIWMLRQLLLEEDGIPYDQQPIIIIANNATGGSALSEHAKGTAPYNRMLQQAAIARTFGRNMGLRVRHFGTNWCQGQRESVDQTGASYYGVAGVNGSGLVKLAADSSADTLALYPEQTFAPKLLTCSTSSGIVGPGRRGIGRAQHKLAIDRPDICLLSSELYHLPYTHDVGEYTDGYQNNAGGPGGGALHPDMIGGIWGGGHEGLARKRDHFDGKDWLPMRPLSLEVEGNSVFITYAVRGDNLILNTAAITPLVNYGVAVRDMTTGNAVAVAQLPRIVGSRVGGGMRTICLTFAGPPSANWRYEFGLGANPELYPYKGGATNFTDDYGLTMRCINKRMFDPMPPHAILPAANAAGFVLTLDA